jgi:hypothetical protein
VPIELGGGMRADWSVRGEALIGVQEDVPGAFETLLSAPIEWDATTPLMWGGTLRLDATVALEMTGLIRGPDAKLPIEIAAGSSVVANAATPAEWLTTAYSDAPGLLEGLQVARADLVTPIEGMGSAQADVPLPGESVSGILREDTNLPTEAGAASQADTSIPVETSGLLYADAPFPFVYLITGYGDYLVGGESQQEAARRDVVSWLGARRGRARRGSTAHRPYSGSSGGTFARSIAWSAIVVMPC